MSKSRFNDIRDRVGIVMGQFQPDRSPPELSVSTVERDLADNGITKVTDIASSDLFTETAGPISKLNLPKVNVDPWSIFWVVLAAMVGGTGITSYLLLIAVPPTVNCRGIAPLSSDGERLYCAQVGAETKELPKLIAAVNLVKGWGDNHPLHGEAQRLLKNWSKDLTKVARTQLNEGNIEQAIVTLKLIPTNSPTYDKTQELLANWSAQAENGATVDAKFEQAMKLGDWSLAFVILQKVQRMRGTYWNTFKHEQMSFKLAQEQDGWDKLQEAKNALAEKESNGYTVGAERPDLVRSPGLGRKGKEKVEEPLPTRPEPIVKAMELANQINSKTYVYAQGQILRNTWSKQLVHLTVERYKSQSFNEAIAIAQKVPADVSFYQEAQDWVKINQAHVSAGKRHLLALMDAIAQVKRIPKTSSVYSIARGKQANWQGLLKQQTQFQWAKTIASVQQPGTLALAINTAKQIPVQSEEGKAAQGEIATWTRQIETVDNRMKLAKAQQIVANGASLANLKAAVNLAGKIGKDRPIGEEATVIVAEWTEKIQTIEDRPIMDNAIALAKQGKLAQAIDVANRITPGRALYREAQSDVRYWYADLQEVADSQTMERAKSLYRRGQISAAIDLASTLGRRSRSYGEARSYLSDWRSLIVPNTFDRNRQDRQ